MLLLWKEGIPYWKVALALPFVGIGVGLAGTPASHSLTGSVPVTRVGMASGTADLQRDLGGAIMPSIFGALLTAGYAAATGAAIAASGTHVTDSTRPAAKLSFASAEASPPSIPQYASADHRGRQDVLPPRRPVGVHWPGSSPSSRRRARLLQVPEARRRRSALLAAYHAQDATG